MVKWGQWCLLKYKSPGEPGHVFTFRQSISVIFSMYPSTQWIIFLTHWEINKQKEPLYVIRAYIIRTLGGFVLLCLYCHRMVMIMTATIFWELTTGQALMNYTNTPHTILGSPNSVYLLTGDKGSFSKAEDRSGPHQDWNHDLGPINVINIFLWTSRGFLTVNHGAPGHDKKFTPVPWDSLIFQGNTCDICCIPYELLAWDNSVSSWVISLHSFWWHHILLSWDF